MIPTLQHILSTVRTRLYLLAIVWLISLVVATIFTHLPLLLVRQALAAPVLDDFARGLATANALGNVVTAIALNVRDVTSVVLLVSLSGGLGSLIVTDTQHLNEIEHPVVQALLGLGLISITILVAGLLGWLPSPLVGTLILVGACALFLRPMRRWWQLFWRAWSLAFLTHSSAFETWLRRAVWLLLALSFLAALAPPTMWDALTYHLEAPRYYLQQGRIVSFLDNHFFGFPHGLEMLYLWLMIVARPQAAAIVHAFFGVLMLLLMSGVARRINRPGAGVVAMVVLLVSNSLWYEFGWPYNDLALMAYVLAALICVLAWRDVLDGSTAQVSPAAPVVDELVAPAREFLKRHALILLAGVFVGFAMSIKYTAASPAIGIGIATFWLARHRGIRFSLVACGMVSVTALAVFAPWLIKNALLDGNPVSPFVWGTARFDSFDQYYYLRPGTGLDWLNALFAPVVGSVWGQEAKAPYGSSAGALIVSLLPLALLVPVVHGSREDLALKALTIFVIPAYLLWLAGAVASYYLVQTRLLFPIFPALALIGAAGVDRLAGVRIPFNPHALSRVAVIVALAAALVGNLAWFVSANTLPVVFGLVSEQHYLEQSLGVYYVAMEQINRLRPASKVIFLWEPKTYYCERTCIPDSLINQWWHDRQLEADPHRIADEWRAQGVTHVLIFEDGLRFLATEDTYEPLTDADVAALNKLRERDLHLIWDGYSSYSLYELQASP